MIDGISLSSSLSFDVDVDDGESKRDKYSNAPFIRVHFAGAWKSIFHVVRRILGPFSPGCAGGLLLFVGGGDTTGTHSPLLKWYKGCGMGVSNWMGVLPSSMAILLAKAFLSEGDGLFVLVMVVIVVCLD